MEVWKLQGTGNDFLLIDDRYLWVESWIKELGLSKEEFVRRLCDRHRGAGADGLILVKKPENPKHCFKWEFYNADGSVAEMCGNGARCAVRFAYEKGICGEEVKFETLAGVVEAKVMEGGRRVKVKLTPPTPPQDKSVPLEEGTVEGVFINTGVPHLVVRVENLEDFPVVRRGRALRFHPLFEPKGTNVNFLEPVGENAIRVRTYERGVEGETLACGTGATACALVAYEKGWVEKKPVRVITKSGEELVVDFSEDLKEVYLTGPVRKVFTGLLSEEVVKG